MPILNRLVDIYERRGFRVASGLNADAFGGFWLAPFTWLFDGDGVYARGSGIALQEVYFLECLFEDYRPKTLFVIGNACGWGTLALALLNPEATVLAIDNGSDRHALEGIEFTNRVAREEGLNAKVVLASSPQDVGRVIGDHLEGPVDFAFIDGEHTNEHIELDFDAVRPHADPACVHLFHDVHLSRLRQGFESIRRRSGLSGRVLLGTPSGMGILYDAAHDPPIERTLQSFSADDEIVGLIEGEAWRDHHRLRVKYRRSLVKRINRIRNLLGRPPLPLP